MANAAANIDLLVDIMAYLSSINEGPDSVIFVKKVQGVTQTWEVQLGDLNNTTLSDVPPLIIKDGPPSNRTPTEDPVRVVRIGPEEVLLVVLPALLALLVLALVMLILECDIGAGDYAYHIGVASLSTVVKGWLLAPLALMATVLCAWVFTPDVRREIPTSTTIPQASPPDEDTTTTLDQDAPVPDSSSPPTIVDEADGITGEDTTDNSALLELDIDIETVRDLQKRLIALDEKLQLLKRTHQNTLRTRLGDGEVDATQPVTPHATEDSTIGNALLSDSVSLRSTSPVIITPDSTESNSASIDSSPAIAIVDSHLNDSYQTPASPTAVQEGQPEQTYVEAS